MAVATKQWNSPMGQLNVHEFDFVELADATTVELLPIQDKNYKVIDAWYVAGEAAGVTAASVLLKNDATLVATMNITSAADGGVVRTTLLSDASYEITPADALNMTLDNDGAAHTFKLFVVTMIVPA